MDTSKPPDPASPNDRSSSPSSSPPRAKSSRRRRDRSNSAESDNDREIRSKRHKGEKSKGQTEDVKLPSAEEKAIAVVEAEKEKKERKIIDLRSGGVYIPPFKLARLRAQVTDKKDTAFQRMHWDALRKSINGLINKVNTTNIKNIIPEIFAENLVRGRGLVCRSVMKAQMASPNFTHVYAALIAVLNTKLPALGELLLQRVIMQFRRAYKRNDKIVCMACTKFLAHLVNQQVAHELLALQLLTLLLEHPSDDSVEVAVDFVKECGQVLTDLSPRGMHGIFERFRGILHEGEIDKRVQYMIEGLFAIRKNSFADFPAVIEELDLVETDDQITHELSLDDNYDQHAELNIFRPDPDWETNEKNYADIKKEILGESDEEEEEEAAAGDDEEEEEEEEQQAEPESLQINDQTDADLINLRRQIYLTIMSSVDFEECAHKLLKIEMRPGQEKEVCNMLIECCSQERTYLRFYGLLGERFCRLNRIYQDQFDECFAMHYATIHRFETNRLRNIGKFFGHLLYSDAFDWSVLSYIHLNEEETTSSSRIFIKILFRELSELMGLASFKKRLEDPLLREHFSGIFPKDHPKNTRFAINFFTSIGLGGLTEDLRTHLKNAPKQIMAQQAAATLESDSESSSSDSDSDSDSSDSSSNSDSSSSDSSSSGSDSSSDSDSSSSDSEASQTEGKPRSKTSGKTSGKAGERSAKSSRRSSSNDRTRSRENGHTNGEKSRASGRDRRNRSRSGSSRRRREGEPEKRDRREERSEQRERRRSRRSRS